MKLAYTTPSKSIAVFANYFQLLLQRPALQVRLSEGVRRRFENNFTRDKKGKVITEVYREIFLRDEKFLKNKEEIKGTKERVIYNALSKKMAKHFSEEEMCEEMLSLIK